MEVLCEAGCDIMAQDLATGLDSLQLAVDNNRADIVRLLVEKYDANPNLKNYEGCNAVHLCAKNGNRGKIFNQTIDIVN